MARNIDDIQRDIERTRRQLASTLDELADRSKPANLANDAKAAATEKLSQQNVNWQASAMLSSWRTTTSCQRSKT